MSVKEVKLEIDNACHHHVETDPVKLYKKTHDSLGWKVTNDCPSDQAVLFCVYDAKTNNLVDPPPFDPCTSTPPGLTIGTPFTVKSGKHARLECTGKDEGRYTKLVLIGGDVPPEGCPPRLPSILTHRLEVEILK